MEKKRIPISDKARFKHRIARLEEYTGEVKLSAGDKVFHRSEHKITAFAPVESCFSWSYDSMDGYIYCLIPRKDITVSKYDYDEVRIDLDEYRNVVDIYFAGTGEVERIRDEKGRVRGRKFTQKIIKPLQVR